MGTEITFTVAFDEADGENIVFFGNYFRIAHRALEQFLPQIGIPWAVWFADPAHGVPLLHAEADYLASLRPGHSYRARIAVEKLGTTSCTFVYEFLDADRVVSRLKTAHVFIDRASKKKLSIPTGLRDKLSRALVSASAPTS